MILIKHFKNSVHTSIVLSKLNNNKFNLFDFIRIFFVRFFFAFSFIRNLKKVKITKENRFEEIYFKDSVKLRDILLSLENYGYNDQLKLKHEILNKIKEDITDENFFVDYKGLYKKENSEKKNLKFNSLDDIVSTTIGYKIKHCILKLKNDNNFLSKVALSKNLLDIVGNYLNSKEIVCKIECFITNPFESTEYEKKKNAQNFHYDCDYKKFIKIFIYLNDVDENSGPHVFVMNTHKKKFLKHILAERINDEEIVKIYGKKNQIKFVKEAGSLIIEDTFGLHKGEVPKSKSRSMIVFEYGIGNSIVKKDHYIKIK